MAFSLQSGYYFLFQVTLRGRINANINTYVIKNLQYLILHNRIQDGGFSTCNSTVTCVV